MAENLRPGDYVIVSPDGQSAKVVSIGKGLVRVQYYDGTTKIVLVQNIRKYLE